jgi:hypothetical protein
LVTFFLRFLAIFILLFFNYTFYTFTPTFILPPQGGGV